MNSEKGQIILTLILVMTVALAIGLSVVQRSLVDVSTSTKVEQSSRAFSAAEAGIEKALQSDSAISSIPLDNQSVIQGVEKDAIPLQPTSGQRQMALEYPPLAKEDVVQVWLADLNSTTNPPAEFYDPPSSRSIDVYWGNSATDRAALELTLVYYNAPSYSSRKWYLDQTARTPANNFDTNGACSGGHPGGYQCKYTIGGTNGGTPDPNGVLPAGLMLLRARLLYNTTSQPFAVQPPSTATCGRACSLPTQARIFTSTGISGETQRKVSVFRLDKVVPPYFDYAIFSAGEITK